MDTDQGPPPRPKHTGHAFQHDWLIVGGHHVQRAVGEQQIAAGPVADRLPFSPDEALLPGGDGGGAELLEEVGGTVVADHAPLPFGQ